MPKSFLFLVFTQLAFGCFGQTDTCHSIAVFKIKQGETIVFPCKEGYFMNAETFGVYQTAFTKKKQQENGYAALVFNYEKMIQELNNQNNFLKQSYEAQLNLLQNQLIQDSISVQKIRTQTQEINANLVEAKTNIDFTKAELNQAKTMIHKQSWLMYFSIGISSVLLAITLVK